MICHTSPTTDPLVQAVLDAKPQTVEWLCAVLDLIHDGDQPLEWIQEMLDWQQNQTQEGD